jgi:nitrogen fixation protein FixH
MKPMSLDTVARPAGKLTGGHVLAILAGFFGVIFVVNGIFLVSALKTHSGGVEADPYRTGLHYNDRIAVDQRQQAMGWQSDVTLVPGEVSLTLRDAKGAPVTGLTVAATVGRPVTATMDKKLHLVETAPGVYRAAAPGVVDGNWLVDVEATPTAASDVALKLRKRVWLKS